MRSPDVVIVGAQKAATTGLLRTLEQHPAVATPRVPEATTLHEGPEGWAGWVRSYEPQLEFTQPEQVLLVKLATAMHFRDTLETIKALNPDARVVTILRHPVDRILSLHRYATQHGLESRLPDEALRDDRIQRAGQWRLNTYSAGSRYAAAIRDIRDVFAPEESLFLDFADATEPATLQVVMAFMRLDRVLLSAVRANESRAPRSGTLARATNAASVRSIGRLAVPARWREAVRSTLHRVNSTSSAPRQPGTTPGLRAELVERHAGDVEAAEEVLLRSLPTWRV